MCQCNDTIVYNPKVTIQLSKQVFTKFVYTVYCKTVKLYVVVNFRTGVIYFRFFTERAYQTIDFAALC